MHISLGLLWVCFQVIHGEITRCSMGGVYEENLCQTLIDDSVFNRYYICGKNKNVYDVYDTPYNSFIGNTEITAVTSTPVIKHVFKLAMTPDRLSREAIKLANELKNNHIIFRQSIIVDDNDQVDSQWNDALSIGTDTYRLKFHNRLLTKFKRTKTLSSKVCMVFIQSYYNAASTHYFSRNYRTAHIVIEEGLEFFKSVEKQLSDDVSINNDNLKVWNALCLTLKEDIENIMNNKNTEAVNQLSDLNKKLLSNVKYFPSSAALFYRRYFLDDKNDATVKRIFESWSPKYKEWESIDDDIMYNKNISMHYYLMFSIFGKEVEDRVSNIIKAIQRPVLCIEDRLLNYEANKLALEMLHHCVEENTEWTSSHNSSCKELHHLTSTNKNLRKIIMPKLSAESYVEHHKKNPIKELYNSLSTQDYVINEKILHVIVTAAIDFMDINSEKYKQIRANIKLAIKFLKKFVEGQMIQLKKKEKTNNIIISDIKKKVIENNNTKHIYESESDESDIDEYDTEAFSETTTSFQNVKNELKENIYAYGLPHKNINYDTEEHMKAVYYTEYSNDGIRMKNIFIAYKWLAELNGVLCNNLEPDILQHQKELKLSIDRAYRFAADYQDFNNIFKHEDHLTYLRLKRKAKILAPISNWEVSNWPGGWISSKENTITLITLDYTTFKDKQSEMYLRLKILKHNLNCPYVNKIELNILLYRYVKKTYPGQYDKMYPYIKNAIDEVVITAEDRVRNMEAHELFSRYLMQRNRNAIEKGEKLSPYEIYKTYLKPIDEDQKRNGPIEPEMDETK